MGQLGEVDTKFQVLFPPTEGAVLADKMLNKGWPFIMINRAAGVLTPSDWRSDYSSTIWEFNEMVRIAFSTENLRVISYFLGELWNAVEQNRLTRQHALTILFNH